MSKSTVTAPTSEQVTIPLDQIHIEEGFNVRDVADTDVQDLAQSVRTLGVLVPVIVAPQNGHYLLTAGHRRYLAAQVAGLTEIPAVVRTGEQREVEAAVENMSRVQLTPLEEARAVKAALDRGLTEDGAAQVLGVSTRLVNNRIRLLALPDDAQQAFDGDLPPGLVAQLQRMYEINPRLGDVALRALTNEDEEWAAEARRNFEDEPVSVVVDAMRDEDGLFSVHTHQGPTVRTFGLKDGDLYDRAVALQRHQYSPWSMPINEAFIDAGRAAGVLVEEEGQYSAITIVTDRDWLLDQFEQAVDRAEKGKTTEGKSEVAKERREAKAKAAEERPQDFQKWQAGVERDLTRRLKDEAPAANLALGDTIMKDLAKQTLTKELATFIAHLVIREASFSQLAGRGIRYCLGEHRDVQTTTLKSGVEKHKITYVNMSTAGEWAKKWVLGGKTGEEILGRIVALYAAARHAFQRGAVTQSDQVPDVFHGWAMNKDLDKAIDKLVPKKVLPKQLTALQTAVAREKKALTIESYREYTAQWYVDHPDVPNPADAKADDKSPAERAADAGVPVDDEDVRPANEFDPEEIDEDNYTEGEVEGDEPIEPEDGDDIPL